MFGKSVITIILLIGTCLGQYDPSILSDIFNINMGTPTAGPSEYVPLLLPLPESKPVTVPTPPLVQVPMATMNGSGSGKPCGYRKECTVQYRCSNGKVNKDGGAIIDVRFGFGADMPCPILETCCSLDDKVDKAIVSPVYKPTTCGLRNPNGLSISITAGNENEAQIGEFPWMVAIMREELVSNTLLSKYHRGGSLITPQVVLTAAHCIHTTQVSKLKVRAGEWEPYSKNEPYAHQDRKVEEMVIHDRFNMHNLHNDIALLFLETPFVLAPNVNTICLPPVGIKFDNSRCFVSGWGKDKFRNGQHVNILKKIDVPVVPHAQCQRNFRRTRLGWYFELDSSFICAGGERGKDACSGDGGSPLVCPIENSQNRYYQAGIVAWGIGCGEENIPGVYASVSHLREWIDEQLNNNDIDSLYFQYHNESTLV